MNKYSLAREDVKLFGSEMFVGENRIVSCPFCELDYEDQGRPSHIWEPTTSLSITREDTGILYNCFRASCHKKGFIPTVVGEASKYYSPKKKEPKRFTRPLKNIPEKLYSFLERRYHISRQEVDNNGFKYDVTEHRLYMPILNILGYTVGAAAKLLKRDSRLKKVINYYDNEDIPTLHFPNQKFDSGPIVVVEDILSSIRVSRICRCVSALGTSLTPKDITQLQQLTDTLVLALDADTWDHHIPIPIKLKQQYGLFFRNFITLKLSKDPKDMTHEELEEVLCGTEGIICSDKE